jgi:hypothetical protein
MADLLEQGSAWLDDQRTAHMSRTVVYQRGAESVEVPATIGRTIFEQVDAAGSGIVQRLESRDFLVLRTDLVLSGIEVIPRAGDRVLDPAGANTELYEVMAPSGGGEPPFRYSDPYRRTLRIHTKHVGSAPGGAP